MKVEPATYPPVSPVTCLVTVKPPSTRWIGLSRTTPTTLEASFLTMVTELDGVQVGVPQA